MTKRLTARNSARCILSDKMGDTYDDSEAECREHCVARELENEGQLVFLPLWDPISVEVVFDESSQWFDEEEEAAE